MNDLCSGDSVDAVCLNSFDCVLVNKEVGCANKTEIKDGLQYANKKPSLPDDMIICYQVIYNYIYIWGFSNELET